MATAVSALTVLGTQGFCTRPGRYTLKAARPAHGARGRSSVHHKGPWYQATTTPIPSSLCPAELLISRAAPKPRLIVYSHLRCGIE